MAEVKLDECEIDECEIVISFPDDVIETVERNKDGTLRNVKWRDPHSGFYLEVTPLPKETERGDT
jgi:hypothetical protein